MRLSSVTVTHSNLNNIIIIPLNQDVCDIFYKKIFEKITGFPSNFSGGKFVALVVNYSLDE